jgi:hypothetical protein
MKNDALVDQIDTLRRSADAQLRMLDGRTTPGDEELAARLDDAAAAYEKMARQESAPP